MLFHHYVPCSAARGWSRSRIAEVTIEAAESNRRAPPLPLQGFHVSVKLRGFLYAGGTEDTGYPLLLLGTNQPFAVAALVVDAFAGEAMYDLLFHGLGCLQRKSVEEPGHALGVSLHGVRTVELASAVCGMGAHEAGMDTGHKKSFGLFALDEQLCGLCSQTGGGFGTTVRSFETIAVGLGDVLQFNHGASVICFGLDM